MLRFFRFAPAGPRGTATAVAAKNMPPACFSNAATVLKALIAFLCYYYSPVVAGLFFMLRFLRFAPAGPRGTATAVAAKNMPPAYFSNAATVLKALIAFLRYYYSPVFAGLFFMLRFFRFAPAGPRGTATAVAAKNMPPACFSNAATVLKALIAFCVTITALLLQGCFLCCVFFALLLRVLAAQPLRLRLKTCHRHVFQTPQQFSKR